MKDFRTWTRDAAAKQILAGPDHRAFLEQVKNQLLIALVEHLGGKVDVRVADLDRTGEFNLALSVVDGNIHLESQRKS